MNVSEGRRSGLIAEFAAEAGPCLLDVHSDADHHRSVLTLAGPAPRLHDAVAAVARAVVARLDLSVHAGVHPRMGVLDVVPFVDLDEPRRTSPSALAARDRFATWAAGELGVPCFVFGPERSLPEVRRRAFRDLTPDTGPPLAHPSAGACAVGARGVLVAYNLWLANADVDVARTQASAIRGPAVRALGLGVGGMAQVSINLIAPYSVGPAVVYDAVAASAEIDRAELVGLIPHDVLHAIDRQRWSQLGLDPSRTIESRLKQAGLDGGEH